MKASDRGRHVKSKEFFGCFDEFCISMFNSTKWNFSQLLPNSVFYRPDALPAAQPTASKHWRHNHWRHFSRLKMANKCVCGRGSVETPLGELTALPRAGLTGPTSKGRRRERETGEMPHVCRGIKGRELTELRTTVETTTFHMQCGLCSMCVHSNVTTLNRTLYSCP